MAEGKHCPECGRDIGYWAIVRGFLAIRCPHCRTRLRYAYTPRMSRATTLVAFGSVFVGLAIGVSTAWVLFPSGGVFASVLVGFAVWFGSAFGLGLVAQFALAPLLRRTQTLTLENAEPESEPEEADW